MSCVTDLLLQKCAGVTTVESSMTVLNATHVMNERRIGAVVVVNAEGRLCGMFTERDVLRRVVAVMRDPQTTRIEDVMTTDLITVAPNDDVASVSELMRDHRVRHVPVIDTFGRLCGMVSIGDINAHNLEETEAKAQMLSDYVYGRG